LIGFAFCAAAGPKSPMAATAAAEIASAARRVNLNPVIFVMDLPLVDCGIATSRSCSARSVPRNAAPGHANSRPIFGREPPIAES
jgi:hypothetical protein